MRPLRLAAVVGALVAGAAVAAVVLPAPVSVLTVLALAAIAMALARRSPARAARERGAGPPATRPAPAVEAVVEQLGTPVFLLDDLFAVVAASEPAAQLFGTTAAEARSRSLIRVTRDHHFLQVAREAAGRPQDVTIEDGRVIRAVARRVSAGQARTVLTLEDLTELRAAQRARTDLVANVSHELRTPIAAARALAETLEGGVSDEARRERFHRQLTAEVERLGRIVDRLLRLSRIESADEPFTIERVAAGELLATAAARIAPIAGPEQRIVVVPTEAPDVRADRERVLEVLANLLDNALRFSPPAGTVTLSAVLDDREVRFEVRDEGPGILPSDRPRVFERFYTGDRARTPGTGGSGLGLAIARHIVGRHRGRIWAAPSERGAVIRFTLPLALDGEREGERAR